MVYLRIDYRAETGYAPPWAVESVLAAEMPCMSHGNPCGRESPPCSAPCNVHTGVLPALLCERRLIHHEIRTLMVEQYGLPAVGSTSRTADTYFPVASLSSLDDAVEAAWGAYLCYFLHLMPKVRDG